MSQGDLGPIIDGIFQRQLLDGERRLGDPHWASGSRRNVGYDILQAVQAARYAVSTAFDEVGAEAPAISRAVEAIDDLIVRWRQRLDDEDGYGIATLHELRRDLAALGPKHSSA